jgi:hypothetical protein
MEGLITFVAGGRPINVRMADLSRFPESVLAQAARMRRESCNIEVPDSGGLFPEVARFLEDPDGYVPPEKEADAIREQLAYFGLVDANTAAHVKTRRQLLSTSHVLASALELLRHMPLHLNADPKVLREFRTVLSTWQEQNVCHECSQSLKAPAESATRPS